MLLRRWGSLILNRTVTFGLGRGHIFIAEIGLSTVPDTFKHAINSAGLVRCHLLGKASKQERNVL